MAFNGVPIRKMSTKCSAFLSLLIIYCGAIGCSAAVSRQVSVIAHMVNTPKSIRWALAQGANGIEIDLQFNGDNPSRFHHGFPCDCTCFLTYATFGGSACKVLGEGCSASTGVIKMMDFLGSTEIVSSSLAVIYIDAKLDNLVPNYAQAGANVVRWFNEKVLARGYRGQIILGSSTVSQFDYLRGALNEASISKYANRYFYAIDQEGKRADKVLKNSLQLGTKYIVYDTGASACFPYKTFHSAIRYSLQSKAYAAVGIWTVDQEAAMKSYINAGVNFIVTNRPKLAADLIGRRNMPLPGRALIPAPLEQIF